MTNKRPWCICTISEGSRRATINQEHPVVARLEIGDRESVLKSANDIADVLQARWKHGVPEQERRRWTCPMERLLNSHAWTHIRCTFSEALRADAEDVLEAEGLPRSALQCLDEDDRRSLGKTLAEAAVSAYQNNCDASATVRQRLVGWLQDWTETGDDDLAGLVRLVGILTGSDSLECDVVNEE